MNEGPEILPAENNESLSDRDRKLNEIAEQMISLTNNIHVNAVSCISMADSEIPDKPAKVDTEKLSELKLHAKQLIELVEEAENATGIIDGEIES